MRLGELKIYTAVTHLPAICADHRVGTEPQRTPRTLRIDDGSKPSGRRTLGAAGLGREALGQAEQLLVCRSPQRARGSTLQSILTTEVSENTEDREARLGVWPARFGKIGLLRLVRRISRCVCIDVLAITPTTAVVRVDMERDAIGDDYTDFDTLIKLDGTWQIIAKGFPMYEG